MLRDEWRLRLTEWTSEQVMFLDESAANERTCDHKYGWAPVGVKAEVEELCSRSRRWSILPLYTEDGFVAWDIIHGSYTAESFNEFICNYVIPHTNPFLGPRSVLCMDNAKIHHNEVLFLL
jgi:DDE superfamily endonuclease